MKNASSSLCQNVVENMILASYMCTQMSCLLSQAEIGMLQVFNYYHATSWNSGQVNVFVVPQKYFFVRHEFFIT